nr:sigma-70 family RNA polymerase sigma factor [Marivirga aurantiaca]
MVEKYKDVSLTLACSIIKDGDAAQDVLQDAFMKVYANIRKFKEKSSFSTWLYRIVVNTSFSALRKIKPYEEVEEVIEASQYSSEGVDVDLLHKVDQEKYIKAALNRMKPEEALVIRLFYLCEFSILEIKDVTDFSESKIKVNLHRGRQNMFALLSRMLGNDLKELL